LTIVGYLWYIVVMNITKKESKFIKNLLLATILSIPIIIILYNFFTNLHNTNVLEGIAIVLPYVIAIYYVVISIIVAIKRHGHSKKTAIDRSLLTCRIIWSILFPITLAQIIILINVAYLKNNCEGSQCSATEAVLIFPFTIVCIILLCLTGIKILNLKQKN